MNVYYQNKALKTLDAKMAFLKGRGSQKASEAIARAIEEGNSRDRTGGKDRYGRQVAPLRSKRTGKYAGAGGPPLAPFGPASRVVRNFHAKGRRRGGFWQVVAGWIDVTSKKGVAFLPFHDSGAGRLPKRPIFGVSPRTWQSIRKVIDEFKRSVRKVRA